MPFQIHISPILERWYPSMEWYLTNESTYRDALSQDKKELQAFLGIINYLSKLSPSMAYICNLLRKLTSAKTEFTWNTTYQKLFNKAKSITKRYIYEIVWLNKAMIHRNVWSGIGLGAALLQTRSSRSFPRDEASDNSILRTIIFVSKSLSSVEKRYNKIGREALGTLYRLT